MKKLKTIFKAFDIFKLTEIYKRFPPLSFAPHKTRLHRPPPSPRSNPTTPSRLLVFPRRWSRSFFDLPFWNFLRRALAGWRCWRIFIRLLGSSLLGLTHQHTTDRELRQCSAVTCFLSEARLPAAIVRVHERAELEESARESALGARSCEWSDVGWWVF